MRVWQVVSNRDLLPPDSAKVGDKPQVFLQAKSPVYSRREEIFNTEKMVFYIHLYLISSLTFPLYKLQRLGEPRSLVHLLSSWLLSGSFREFLQEFRCELKFFSKRRFFLQLTPALNS